MPQNLFIVPIFFYFFFNFWKQNKPPTQGISFHGATVEDFCFVVYLIHFWVITSVLLLCVLNQVKFNSYTTMFCTVWVLYCLYRCTCVCLFVVVALFSPECFPTPPVTPKEALGLREGAVAEVPGWDASAEPHTMPDLLCAALLFNWNSIGLPRYRKRGAEELPHKSVFRSASAELWTFLQSVFLELPGGREA